MYPNIFVDSQFLNHALYDVRLALVYCCSTWPHDACDFPIFPYAPTTNQTQQQHNNSSENKYNQYKWHKQWQVVSPPPTIQIIKWSQANNMGNIKTYTAVVQGDSQFNTKPNLFLITHNKNGIKLHCKPYDCLYGYLSGCYLDKNISILSIGWLFT